MSSAAEHRHRPTMPLARVVELLIAALSRAHGDHSSVELTRNAKGDVQIKVGVRTGEQGIETLEQAVELARKQYDELATAYPMGGDDAGQ